MPHVEFHYSVQLGFVSTIIEGTDFTAHTLRVRACAAFFTFILTLV